ncbi:MAG: hypothetical protein ISS15_16665 [Alphaproteobacteria bacterium]|nr:hypothetical protein [Alphaproteobacteria bacterium]MBL6937882.1 hypothetical protein [Alphaproteobacteria bacterium]MBL7099293.1 hypothetical protein [Alphaproteobacteria bacterium]
MTHYVVDTNVAVVANGRDGQYDLDCRLTCVLQIQAIKNHARHRTVLDDAGEILKEYHRLLNPHGQPGVGDEFYRFLLNFQGNAKRVLRVTLDKDAQTGQYIAFPKDAALANFDPSDRKFVAAARRGKAIVINAVDSDWKKHATPLKKAGVSVKELCPTCLT